METPWKTIIEGERYFFTLQARRRDFNNGEIHFMNSHTLTSTSYETRCLLLIDFRKSQHFDLFALDRKIVTHVKTETTWRQILGSIGGILCIEFSLAQKSAEV